MTDAQVAKTVAQLDDSLGKKARRRPAEGARPHARRPVGPRAPDPALRRGADGRRRRRHVGSRSPAAVRGQPRELHHRAGGPHPGEDARPRPTTSTRRSPPPAPPSRTSWISRRRSRSTRPPKQNSGSLGSAVASTYVPEFAAAAIALEPGEISKPVKTEFGWHVIRMVDKDVQSFDDVKQQLIDASACHGLQRLAARPGRGRRRRRQPEVRPVRRGDAARSCASRARRPAAPRRRPPRARPRERGPHPRSRRPRPCQPGRSDASSI